MFTSQEKNGRSILPEKELQGANETESVKSPVAETLSTIKFLLEQYAPLWFTEDLDTQAVSALQDKHELHAKEILAEFYRLLEAFAPAWYGPEHREMLRGALQRKD